VRLVVANPYGQMTARPSLQVNACELAHVPLTSTWGASGGTRGKPWLGLQLQLCSSCRTVVARDPRWQKPAHCCDASGWRDNAVHCSAGDGDCTALL
jgi:hypothetical protein